MGQILEQAISALREMPTVDSERIAWEIIERLEDKNEWDRIVGMDKSQNWLGSAAEKALREYEKISKHLSLSAISVPFDNLLREGAYWKGFDDLPADVRILAENNYKLWQENPTHPKLRFKQIHRKKPIFSFRVGMRHRTVGIRSDDDKIVWFWIGSFQQFESMIQGK